MKKMISNILVSSFMMTSMTTFAQAQSLSNSVELKASSISKTDSNSSFRIILANYKKAVYQDGGDNTKASKDMMAALVSANMKLEDIKSYALSEMSLANYKEFSKTLDKGIMTLNGSNLSPNKVNAVVESLIKNEAREGAQWISCEAGLGIGIPLMVAGIVTGIVALSMKKVQVSGVQKKYIEDRKAALDAYTKLELNRQDNILTIESDISAYESAIAELQRKIASGNYGALETENMNQQIAVLNVNISDAQSDIAQLVNDQPQLYLTFQNNIAFLNEKEVNEMAQVSEDNARKETSKNVLGIVSGVTIPFGLVLVLGSDC